MQNTYAYQVKDHNGHLIKGSIEAESTALVANKLRQMGYVPIAIDNKDTGGVKHHACLQVPL